MQKNFEEFQFRLRRVSRHDLEPYAWLERHQAVSADARQFNRDGLAEVAKHLFVRLRYSDNLIVATDYVKEYGGVSQAWGEKPDFQDRTEVSAFARGLRDHIDQGKYQHAPTKLIRVTKASGHGKRPLHLLTFEDRVVHRAVVQALQPVLDPIFDPRSFGGRPERDRTMAVALAEHFAQQGRLVWVIEDLRNAFEHVRQARLLDVLRKYLPVSRESEIRRLGYMRQAREGLHSFLQKVLIAPRVPGLRQGAASSPLFFNLYLHHLLDRTWREQSFAPMIRYADNLLIACRSVDEAHTARTKLEEILRPTGFKLKPPPAGTSNVVDLRADAVVEWLGYRIRWNGSTLRVSVAQGTGDRILDKLRVLRAKGPSADAVRQFVSSWLSEAGPAYCTSQRTAIHAWIAARVKALELGGMPPAEEFETLWWRASTRWEVTRKRAGDLDLGTPLFV